MKHVNFFLNYVHMEELSIDYPNLETKSNRGLENEQIMKMNLQKLHAQRVKRRLDGRNAFIGFTLMLMITKKLTIQLSINDALYFLLQQSCEYI